MVMLLGDHLQLYHVTPQAKNNRAIELLTIRMVMMIRLGKLHTSTKNFREN